MNRRKQILFLCIIFGIGIVAIIAGIVMYTHASTLIATSPAERIQSAPAERENPIENITADQNGTGLSVSTFDESTGKPLESVFVYLDGGYEGLTSAQGILGILNISSSGDGQHTIRVTKSGYKDLTKSVVIPSVALVKIGLQEQLFVPVQEYGSHETKIDIVFIPSSTAYNCAERRKILTTGYVTGRSAFVTDVNRIVNDSLFTLDAITDTSDPLPPDYRERYNIYYYYDSTLFADAFSGCAGTIPEKFWNDVPFTDVAIILYPTYYTLDTGEPCEPNGCVNPGTGRRWMKIPSDQPVLFQHEYGHAIFGLVDTYCDNTMYWQNEPEPNVWSSRQSCEKDAAGNAWASSECRQIRQDNPASCTKPFWRIDADPDIMHEGYSGTFGKAATRRITYTFDNINAWGKRV